MDVPICLNVIDGLCEGNKFGFSAKGLRWKME